MKLTEKERREWEKLLPSEEDIAFIKRISKTIQEHTTTCRQPQTVGVLKKATTRK
jgi:hypothetical protein